MEIVSPGLQGTDNCKEFPVVNVVVSFSRDERLREIGVGVPIAVCISLKEDGARSVFGGISGNGKGFREVREVEDRVRQEELL